MRAKKQITYYHRTMNNKNNIDLRKILTTENKTHGKNYSTKQ